MRPSTNSLFDWHLIRRGLIDSFSKLNPRAQMRSPIIACVLMGAFVTSVITLAETINYHFSSFNLQITLWLWFTVLFANFSEAIAEGRGKAQAETLRKSRKEMTARRLRNGPKNSNEERIPASQLSIGDIVVCEAGDLIPGDGEVIEGIASVDESAITGESAPVIRESGGDRSAVTGGTKVLSDRIVVRITVQPGNSFIDRVVSLVEGAKRQMTPNEVALSILLVTLTVLFLIVVTTLKPFFLFSAHSQSGTTSTVTFPILISLFVCLIPTTIGGLLSAIGISGMDRLLRKNVIATSGRAVEAAGDVDVLLLDKTGTITFGNRMATEFIALPGIEESFLAQAAQLSSLSDETPEGRSIVILAKQKYRLREWSRSELKGAQYIPFSAHTRISGIDIGSRTIRKGAVDAISKDCSDKAQAAAIQKIANRIANSGGTPLLVSENGRPLGLIHLKDVVKGGIQERFAQLRRMGIRTVMITGDNPLTAAAIAAESGVDEFLAEATPESKLKKIREEQAQGHLVAMTGDGTNDAPALAQADVGVAMNSGTQAAREAGNMVDLDSNPTKLIDIVETGKQLLITRGALTTFSISNDVAKYFAILPAIFGTLYATSAMPGPLKALDIMRLHSPESAILSAVIFNALIIIGILPLALRGVRWKPMPATALLTRNLLIYGLGGLITPFLGIKLIDILLTVGRLI